MEFKIRINSNQRPDSAVTGVLNIRSTSILVTHQLMMLIHCLVDLKYADGQVAH